MHILAIWKYKSLDVHLRCNHSKLSARSFDRHGNITCLIINQRRLPKPSLHGLCCCKFVLRLCNFVANKGINRLNEILRVIYRCCLLHTEPLVHVLVLES